MLGPERRSRWKEPRTYLALYALALVAIAFWPTPVDQGAGPLLGLITQLVPVLTYERIEFLANVVLFVPLGVLLTVLLARNRWLVVPIAFLVTVTIESVQAVMLDARTPSLHDVVANTAGACRGAVAVVLWERRRDRMRNLSSEPGILEIR